MKSMPPVGNSAPLAPLSPASVESFQEATPLDGHSQSGHGGPSHQRDAIISPEVHGDRCVTFRLDAPQAQTVRLIAPDIPENGQGSPMAKNDGEIWEVTLGPIHPGAYRYNFNVDRVAVIDPRSPSISESNNNVWSLVYIPGSDFLETKDVPHGAVSAVTYYSSTLKRFRRMHVYTPPGFEIAQRKYPVLYLLHGAGDCDESWTSVGRAGFILDNLIAEKKARPMVVVMPAGHTIRTARGTIGGPAAQAEFLQEFVHDIMPYAETRYRIETDRQHRAIAGSSMGGSQALNIVISHLNKFAYIGIYSSGLISEFANGLGTELSAARVTKWQEHHRAQLDDSAARNGLKLLWFITGANDGLITTTRSTVDLLKKHGFNPIIDESPGGHTWINWRTYLNEFITRLFR